MFIVCLLILIIVSLVIAILHNLYKNKICNKPQVTYKTEKEWEEYNSFKPIKKLKELIWGKHKSFLSYHKTKYFTEDKFKNLLKQAGFVPTDKLLLEYSQEGVYHKYHKYDGCKELGIRKVKNINNNIRYKVGLYYVSSGSSY